MPIDNKAICEMLIQIGREQELGAMVCIMVNESGADIQFLRPGERIPTQALRTLACTLREVGRTCRLRG